MGIKTRDTPFGSVRLEGFVRVRLLSYATSILNKKLTVLLKYRELRANYLKLNKGRSGLMSLAGTEYQE